jgi:hypothetical protein
MHVTSFPQQVGWLDGKRVDFNPWMKHPQTLQKTPKVSPKAKQQKKKRIGACSLIRNTSGVRGHAGTSRWD